MNQRFDVKSVPRTFNPGDKVLVLLPIPGSALSACFSVDRKLNETTHVICTPDRRRKKQTCHINMLKLFHERHLPDESLSTLGQCDSCRPISFMDENSVDQSQHSAHQKCFSTYHP